MALQNPHEMGKQAMKAAVRMLDGENLGGEVTGYRGFRLLRLRMWMSLRVDI